MGDIRLQTSDGTRKISGSRAAMVALGAAITLLAIYWVLYDIDLPALGKALVGLPVLPFVYAFLIMLAVTLLRVLRLQVLARPTGASFWMCLETMFIGYFFLTVLPLRLGELVRVGFLSRRAKAPILTAAAAATAERSLDLITLAGMAAVFLSGYVGRQFAALPIPHWLLGAAAVAGIFGIVAVGVYARQRLDRTTEPTNRFGKWLSQFLDGLAVLGSTKDFLLSVGLSVALWCGVIFTYRTALTAIGLSFSPADAAVVMLGTSFGIALPSLPGFFGTYHAGFLSGAMLIGIPKETVLPVAVAMHLMIQASALILGGLFVFTGGRKALARPEK